MCSLSEPKTGKMYFQELLADICICEKIDSPCNGQSRRQRKQEAGFFDGIAEFLEQSGSVTRTISELYL